MLWMAIFRVQSFIKIIIKVDQFVVSPTGFEPVTLTGCGPKPHACANFATGTFLILPFVKGGWPADAKAMAGKEGFCDIR